MSLLSTTLFAIGVLMIASFVCTLAYISSHMLTETIRSNARRRELEATRSARQHERIDQPVELSV